MRRITIFPLILSLLFTLGTSMQGWSQNPWADKDALHLQIPEDQQISLPDAYRLLELNTEQLQSLLSEAPLRSEGSIGNSTTIIEFPMPDGEFVRFKVQEASVMHPDLARKFPEIKSYAGQGLYETDKKIFFDLSPTGFHAIVLSNSESPVFIFPVAQNDTQHYLSYYQRDFLSDLANITCGVTNSHPSLVPQNTENLVQGDCQFRQYRLAVASNVEFTAAAGGTVGNAMAQINTLVTIVNGVYQVELSVGLQLVANNNNIIFTAEPDGYTNGNQNTMASENQGIVDGAIGNGNYDIAHALGTNPSTTGSSGVSLGIGTVCNGGSKAMGATIFGVVPMTPGAITLIMHEWGHQFGANHTFNEQVQPICSNPGQLNAATAFEPGSGSTIMSYAGTCGASNVQSTRDRYFHAISLQEIGNYVTVGGGSCPTPVAVANNQPTVNAGADYTIPVSTPFMLTATGSDADGDPITYCWEQMDNELISHPPANTATQGPVFRTFPAVSSPTRWFPNLAALASSTPTPWEVLPSVARTMNFRVTIRDNVLANGCTNEDDMVITVADDSGPFSVNDLSGPGCYFAEAEVEVTWNVAGTDEGAVDCDNVDILLSEDGGLTFPYTLITGTPNDGSALVNLPTVITEEARLMVKGSDNIFFNISPTNFTIDCVPTLTVTDNPASGVYRALNTVQTSGDVQVLGYARFYAGEEVILNPGFEAIAGCDFIARIQPCDPCTPALLPGLVETPPLEQGKVTISYLPGFEDWQDRAEGTTVPLRVYPNPFTDRFTLEFDLDKQQVVQASLTDVNGRVIRQLLQDQSLEAGSYRFEVDLSMDSDGIYFCRIQTQTGLQQIKLLKINN